MAASAKRRSGPSPCCPLGERQIEAFARSLGVGDPAAFLAEIRRRDAWTFARRPLDLIALAEVWRDTRELGARARQHEASIAAKLSSALRLLGR